MKNKTLLKTVSLAIIQIFLLTGLACPDTLRVPMMYETGIANKREPFIQQNDSGEAVLNLNVLNSILRDVSKELAKKNQYVDPIVMGSAVYLADEKGLVKFSAIEDIDIALATNIGMPGDYLDPFFKELMNRLLSFAREERGLLKVSITLNPPRIFLEAGGVTKRISTPVGGPDLAKLFIETMLKDRGSKSESSEKRSKRALAILYYAGTFFHKEDMGWFTGFRKMYLDAYQNNSASAEKVMSVIEQQALGVQEQYTILEDSNNPEKLMVFKEYIREKIGAPDYKIKDGVGRRKALNNALQQLAFPAAVLSIESMRDPDLSNIHLVNHILQTHTVSLKNGEFGLFENDPDAVQIKHIPFTSAQAYWAQILITSGLLTEQEVIKCLHELCLIKFNIEEQPRKDADGNTMPSYLETIKRMHHDAIAKKHSAWISDEENNRIRQELRNIVETNGSRLLTQGQSQELEGSLKLFSYEERGQIDRIIKQAHKEVSDSFWAFIINFTTQNQNSENPFLLLGLMGLSTGHPDSGLHPILLSLLKDHQEALSAGRRSVFSVPVDRNQLYAEIMSAKKVWESKRFSHRLTGQEGSWLMLMHAYFAGFSALNDRLGQMLPNKAAMTGN